MSSGCRVCSTLPPGDLLELDVVLGDPPARVGGPHYHLQRVAAAPVGEVQAEQCLAAGGPPRRAGAGAPCARTSRYLP